MKKFYALALMVLFLVPAAYAQPLNPESILAGFWDAVTSAAEATVEAVVEMATFGPVSDPNGDKKIGPFAEPNGLNGTSGPDCADPSICPGNDDEFGPASDPNG